MSSVCLPQTIRQPVCVQGIGYWSGEPVRVEFRPAPAGSGIVFVRDDLGPEARVAAAVENRIDVPRRTNLVEGQVRVDMVEHVLAALAGMGIDNCEVGVDSQEMPGCDGSSKAFVDALESVGSVAQAGTVPQLVVTESVRAEAGDSWIEAHPPLGDEFCVRYELSYAHEPVIGEQVAEVELTPATFRSEVAACRTFILEREAVELRRRGLGEGVTNRDLLVFGNEGPLENSLHFSNECARHKLLDVVGDLALTGHRIAGRVVAHRCGHRLNAELAGELLKRFAKPSVLRESA